MTSFGASSSAFIITLVFVHAEWFVHNENTNKTENEVGVQFLKFHSDHITKLGTKPWPLADDLNEKTLQLVCDEVLADNPTPFRPPGEFSYIDPEGKQPLQTERVVRNASLVCSLGIAFVTLIHCSYNGTDFYLAEGNETLVFRIAKDPAEELYYFQSVHDIHYKN